jgi:hypothetical protein
MRAKYGEHPADAGRIQSEFQRVEAAIAQEPELKSSQQLVEDFGVSSSTIERVRTILDQGTPEQIQSLRKKNETRTSRSARRDCSQIRQALQKDSKG